ncbi:MULTISPECIES: phage tail protein [unclassified Micromonospora]|uniref:phage tail protein n=1 Tax=unclassified Micromonospora TaxID=2617518 RepID=UPI0015908BFA|nr:phage tail protein [Verrucosispora sp. NA02020]QKW12970.1 phage tail protein [Verrucosispora sp. NA02020]
MRGTVAGLGTPHPFGRRLPAIYATDEVAGRLLAAFDEVLAPVHATLDNLAAYLDPRLAPADFVDWLAGWVAAETAPGWTLTQRREAVAGAVARHRVRGTAQGLAEQVQMIFGVRPEITENGGTAWSSTSGGPLPGTATPALTVTVRVAEPDRVPLDALRALVEANRPAHVPCTVRVVAGGQPAEGDDDGAL